MCFSDYDLPEFITQEILMACKPHKCCECRRTINPGELYEYASGIWDGEFDAFATCAECSATRNDVIDREASYDCEPHERVPPFGGLLEIIGEYDPPIERRSLEYGIAFIQARKDGKAT